MSLYKRDNTWWVDFTTASGVRIKQSADTSNKLQAQELHHRLKAESWRVERLGDRRQYTWDDAAAKWLEETSHKRTHHDDVLKLRWLRQYLEDKVLTGVTRDVVAAIGAHKRHRPVLRPRTVTWPSSARSCAEPATSGNGSRRRRR